MDSPCIRIEHGDCLDVLRTLESDSIDALICDPPAGIAFMGAEWDTDKGGRDAWVAWLTCVMREAFRVLKPGAHGFVWSLPRTSHWTATALENAGFEIRDRVAHMFGSGFPKSHNVTKKLDETTKKQWLNVSKRLDDLSFEVILKRWIEHSRTVSNAGLVFEKSPIEIGTNTLRSDSALAPVAVRANPESSSACAVVAELASSAALRTFAANSPSAASPAENITSALLDRASSAECRLESHEAKPDTTGSSVPPSAWVSLNDGPIAEILASAEALKIWLGRTKSSDGAATGALCAALTQSLKRTILNRSKAFLSFDTTRQTECVRATTVTITEFTAACLISSTVDTLRKKSLAEADAATREVVGTQRLTGNAALSTSEKGGTYGVAVGVGEAKEIAITAPATEAAKQWDGWGTALKPAVEDWWLVRKPPVGTVAANVLEHGVGAINVDACRVGNETRLNPPSGASASFTTPGGDGTVATGRWPANVVLTHSAACLEVGSRDVKAPVINRFVDGAKPFGGGAGHEYESFGGGTESIAVYECVDGCPVRALDERIGHTASPQPSVMRRGATTGRSIGGAAFGTADPHESIVGHGDSGGASRFFNVFPFVYVAKTSTRERNAGCEKLEAVPAANTAGTGLSANGDGTPRNMRPTLRNTHPTVKPQALMRHLVRMIAPQGGTVLDPFAGSGSTLVACVAEGCSAIGVELDAQYLEIIRARVAHAEAQRGLQVAS